MNIEFKDRKIFSKILFIDLGGILTSKYEEGSFLYCSKLIRLKTIRFLNPC